MSLIDSSAIEAMPDPFQNTTVKEEELITPDQTEDDENQIKADSSENDKNLFIADQTVKEKKTNLQYTPEITNSFGSVTYKNKFLLKSFIILLIFNLVVSIPVLIIAIFNFDPYRFYIGLVSLILLSLISLTVEFNTKWFIENPRIFYIVTFIYGLFIMACLAFLPYPEYTSYFSIIFIINSILLILIALIPFNQCTIFLMIVSNIISVTGGYFLIQYLPFPRSLLVHGYSRKLSMYLTLFFSLLIGITRSIMAIIIVKDVNEQLIFASHLKKIYAEIGRAHV